MERTGESAYENTPKQITFDLSVNLLKKYYPIPRGNTNPFYYKKAWKDIERFMKQNGFNHRQYSVYISEETKTSLQITALARKMVHKMPWIYKCLEEIDVTYIGNKHSLMDIVKNTGIKLEKDLSRNVNDAENKNIVEGETISRIPTRKQITFDLSVNMLKKYYPKPQGNINPFYYRKAWRDIAKFMKQNGFSHRQYSVYDSNCYSLLLNFDMI